MLFRTSTIEARSGGDVLSADETKPFVLELLRRLRVPSLKLTARLQLKMDGWKTILSFWDGLFSGAMFVSFRECVYFGWTPTKVVKAFRALGSNPLDVFVLTEKPDEFPVDVFVFFCLGRGTHTVDGKKSG